MSGRKGIRSQKTRRKSARYEPYGRPRKSEVRRPERSRTARVTGVGTGLVGELLGEGPSARLRSARVETSGVETSTQSQYSEDIEDDKPIDYDARSYETTKGVASAADLELWTRPAAEFIRSGIGSIGSSNDWIGKRPLGEGGFGLAGLWERLGEDGTPVDQLCVKQIGRDRSGDWDPAIPQEVKIMYHMHETDCAGAIEIRGYKRYLRESIHRIFMEYCPHGDLRRLYKRYRRFRQHFPEAFLWEVFHYQIEAAAAMANGPVNGHWEFEEIIHRDIKPGNVFLANPDLAENPFYPVAKLGDWGLAIETAISDSRNPGYYTGAGTRGYMAPEQRPTRNLAWYLSGPHGRLSCYTNIWAIGATMYELLTLHHVKKALYPNEINEDGEGLAEIRTKKEPEYTDALRTLVRSCLRPNPQDRPDIRQLQKIITSSRSEFKLEGSRLRGEDQFTPHESERLYYLGKEIESMKAGRWEPTDPDLTEGEESGFRDPRYSAMRFPDWRRVKKTDDDDEDRSSSSDGERATRRIQAGYTGDTAQVTGSSGGNGADEMIEDLEEETGSLGGEMTRKAPEQAEYQPPDRNTWDRLDEVTISEEEMQRMRARG